MLGWEFFISRQHVSAANTEKTVAFWKAGIGGTHWIDALVSEGRAADLGGNGYPLRYSVTAGVLLSVLRRGLPNHEGPPVIGDNYVMPKGWVGEGRVKLEILEAIPSDEVLLVEAWDQS